MSNLLALWRFFRVVPPVPPLIVGLLVATTAAAGLVIFFEPPRAAEALVPLFVLQAFAASSGFMVPARRGYYDMLLTRVGRRLRVLFMHWVASILPGATCWFALAAIEMAARASTHTATLSSGSLAALWAVSCISWATTTTLPRFGGALGWLIAFIAGKTLLAIDQANIILLINDPQPSFSSALAFIVYPAGLLGQQVPSGRLLTVAPGVVFATVLAVGAGAWLHRTDIRLEAAQ